VAADACRSRSHSENRRSDQFLRRPTSELASDHKTAPLAAGRSRLCRLARHKQRGPAPKTSPKHRVVFLVGAGVMSALGLLIRPPAFELARSRCVPAHGVDALSIVALKTPGASR